MAPMTLETPRLHLRPMTSDDVPALLRVFGDAGVMRFYPAPFDEARVQLWVPLEDFKCLRSAVPPPTSAPR